MDAPRHLLQELAEEFGVQAALDLAEWRGGLPLYIPQRMDDDHPIVTALGRDVADWLQESWGCGWVKVPAAKAYWREQRDRALVADLERETGEAVARRYKLDIRSVWRIKASHGQGGGQPLQGSLL